MRSWSRPAASELIFPLSLAVQRGLTVNEIAATFAVYPSLSGSLAEAARQLVQYDDRSDVHPKMMGERNA